MFNLYTDKKYLKDTDMLVHNIEASFYVHVAASSFDDTDLDVMRKIDSAELLDSKTGAIQTPFGLTDIEHLSSGCKTVLLYLNTVKNRDKYNKRPVINILECGENALRILIRLADGLNSDVALFATYISGIRDGDGITCVVNDKEVINDILYSGV